MSMGFQNPLLVLRIFVIAPTPNTVRDAQLFKDHAGEGLL